MISLKDYTIISDMIFEKGYSPILIDGIIYSLICRSADKLHDGNIDELLGMIKDAFEDDKRENNESED